MSDQSCNLPPNHNEFALAAEAAPNNMNGWIEEEEDPEMEEEEDPEEDPEMEEEEEEMDVDADEEWDGPEWMLPYQGADPLNPSPPVSDSESEIEFEEAEAEAEAEAEVEVAPIPPPPVPVDHEPEAEAATVGTGRLTRLFTNTQVWTGSSSSYTAIGHDPEDLTPSHIRSDLDALHHRRGWSIEVQKHLPPHLHFQEAPYVLPSSLRVPVTHNDPRDPYIAARDATTASATDNDDPPTHEETSPSEPRGSSPRDS
ncbi:hypothetical protein Tco_0579182 [Tanacetum coccineum]